jgi:N-methylhydantoinase B
VVRTADLVTDHPAPAPSTTATAPPAPVTGGMTVHGVSREAATADNGVVLTDKWDDGSMWYDAPATDVAGAAGPAPAEVVLNRGGGYAQLWGCAPYADIDVVGP